MSAPDAERVADARRADRRLRRQRRQPRHRRPRARRRRRRRRAARDRSLRDRRRRHAARRAPRQARPLRLDPQRAVSRPEPGDRSGERPTRGDRQRAAAGEHVLDLDRSARPLPALGVVRLEPGRGQPDRRRRRRRRGAAGRRDRRERARDPGRSEQPLRLRDLPRRRRRAADALRRRDRPPRATTPCRRGARAPAPGRATSSFIRPTRSSSCSTSSTRRSTSSRSTARPARCAASRSPTRCPRDFAGGAPWAADLHLTPDGRFLYASERRSSTLARSPSTPSAARCADRDGGDRGRAARLRDLARRPLPDRRRPGVASPQPLRDRRRERRARPRRRASPSAAIRTGSRSSSCRVEHPSERPSAVAIAVAGCVALAVAMGIGRFAFTPILPMMLHDGVVDLHAASWLASANYLGYLIGALLCTLRAAALVAPAAAAADRRPGAGSHRPRRHRRAHARDGAAVAGGLAGAALPRRRRQRDGVRVSSGWCLAQLAARGRAALGGAMFAGPGAGIVASGLLASAMVAWRWHVGARRGSSSACSPALLTASVWRVFATRAAERRCRRRASTPSEAQAGDAAPARAPSPQPHAPHGRAEVATLAFAYGISGFGYIVTATFLPVIARAALPPARPGSTCSGRSSAPA